LTPDNAAEDLSALILALIKSGEPSHATRSSIHIHVGFPQSLPLLRKATRFSLLFEALFYRLGSMRYEPRVFTNNAIYCRPLSGEFGPPVVSGVDERKYQISDVNVMLKARTVEEFWGGLGVDYSDPQRYHPARYYGLNILSILLHGTLEFRYFNKSLVVCDVVAIMRLCHACTELINRVPESELSSYPTRSVFTKNDELRDLKLLLYLIAKYNQDSVLSEETISDLFSLLNQCSPVILQEKYVETHLNRNFSLQKSLCELRRRITAPIEPPGNLDIHHFDAAAFNILREIK
jgi:hypothetical protein